MVQHLHNYVEPGEAGRAEPLPLADGTLRHNLGVPIVFVCTKVDATEALVRERRISEEQLDYVQQVLRTVALLYGAALVATSEAHPETFETLRAYVRHRLFATPFTARPSSVELSSLLVPSGWDSWAQIRVLSERFDCAALADAWAAELAGDERGVTALVAQMLPVPGAPPAPSAAQRVVLPDARVPPRAVRAAGGGRGRDAATRGRGGLGADAQRDGAVAAHLDARHARGRARPRGAAGGARAGQQDPPAGGDAVRQACQHAVRGEPDHAQAERGAPQLLPEPYVETIAPRLLTCSTQEAERLAARATSADVAAARRGAHGGAPGRQSYAAVGLGNVHFYSG